MRRKKEELTGRQIEHLLYGFSLDKFPFKDEEHRKELYFKHKDYLMSLQGLERVPGVFGHTPLRKGKKPQAWEDYEKRTNSK